MHRSVLLLGALTLLLYAPSATACSFAREPDPPGLFFIWEPSTGKETRIEVEGRELGAGCELSNPFSFDGQRFAWAENPSSYFDDDPTTVYILQSLTGPRQVLPLKGARQMDLSLAGDDLYHIVFDPDAITYELWRYSFDERTDEALALPLQMTREYRMGDGWIAWPRSTGGDVARINVYDARDESWVVQAQEPKALGLPTMHYGVRAVGGGWLILVGYLEGREETWAYEPESGSVHNLTREVRAPTALALDGERIYYLGNVTKGGNNHLLRAPVAGGPKEDLGELPHPLASGFGAAIGRVVLGSYEFVSSHPHSSIAVKAAGWFGPSPPVAVDSDEPIEVLPVPGALVVLAAFVVASQIRRGPRGKR